MYQIIKRIVSKNTILYTIWFYLIRKKKGVNTNFFSKKTTLYITGFPRSGNTFLTHLSKNIFPDEDIVHHFHSIAPIKIALKKNISTFILFRDPLNAISSFYLKKLAMQGENFNGAINHEAIEIFIKEYISYYEFVKEHSDELFLVSFDTLIKCPNLVLAKISESLEIQKNFSERDIENAVNTYRGAKDTLGSSKPNSTKENYKHEIKSHILASENHYKLTEIKKELNSLLHV